MSAKWQLTIVAFLFLLLVLPATHIFAKPPGTGGGTGGKQTLGDLTCQDGQINEYDATNGLWVCGNKAVDDSTDGVKITFARVVDGAEQHTLDINGLNLVSDANDPVVTFGDVPLQVLATQDLGSQVFQVITDIPAGTLAGTYDLTLSNNQGTSSFVAYVPMDIPVPGLLHSGANWEEVTPSAGWVGRHGHQSVVYDNKMWVMGGSTINSQFSNDIWSSTDGVTWTQVITSGAWSIRTAHQAIVYDNKMWVMGGFRYDQQFSNGVWSSTGRSTLGSTPFLC